MDAGVEAEVDERVKLREENRKKENNLLWVEGKTEG